MDTNRPDCVRVAINTVTFHGSIDLYANAQFSMHTGAHAVQASFRRAKQLLLTNVTTLMFLDDFSVAKNYTI